MKQAGERRLLGPCLRSGKAGVLLLIDPDRHELNQIERRASRAMKAGVSGLLVGSSFLASDRFERAVEVCRGVSDVPVVLFPGSGTQLSPHADGLLLLSLISGRNPELLIGEHVRAAFQIKRLGIEVLPTGYMLVESGAMTSALFMSNTIPLPNNKPELAAAHALAGEQLGMQLIYMDGGSGARRPVSTRLTRSVARTIDIPLIVGGGLRDAQGVAEQIEAGAGMVVVGTAIEEQSGDSTLLEEMVSAAGSVSLDRSISS